MSSYGMTGTDERDVVDWVRSWDIRSLRSWAARLVEVGICERCGVLPKSRERSGEHGPLAAFCNNCCRQLIGHSRPNE
jgi:hypothetical protein